MEIEATQPVRTTTPRQPMGWPEAATKIVFYVACAVCLAGWPKIIKQVKLIQKDPPKSEELDNKLEGE